MDIASLVKLTSPPVVRPSMSVIDFVPEGVLGEAEVIHFNITKKQEQLLNMCADMDGDIFKRRWEGRYAELLIRGECVMSDTHLEQFTNYEFLDEAKGRVLVAGLGLGMVLPPLEANPRVKEILVVEKNKDVIDLIGYCFRIGGPKAIKKFMINHSDIHDFEPSPKPELKWDTIYFDIWPGREVSDLREMYALEEKFKPFLAEGGWIGCWNKFDMECRKRNSWE